LDPLGIIVLVLIVTCSLVAYFVPTLIALRRQHPHVMIIALLNFFLGWTMLGWFAGLVWSATRIPPGAGGSGSSHAAGQGPAGVLVAAGLAFSVVTAAAAGVWWQQRSSTLADASQAHLGVVPLPQGAASQPSAQPGTTPPIAQASAAGWPANLAEPPAGSVLAPALFQPTNVWVYRVTRTADRPATDEMSPLVYYQRITAAPSMDATAQRFAYLRQDDEESVERVLQLVRSEGGDTKAAVRLTTGGSGDLPVDFRSLVVEGVTYNVFGGELLDGERSSQRRRITYIDPRVGIVHETYAETLQGFRRRIRVDLVGARVGGVTWGDVETPTPFCDTQRTVFRDRGLLTNEFSDIPRTFQPMQVARASGYQQLTFEQDAGTVSMYGDGDLVMSFPQTQFYAAKSIPAADGQLVLLELDSATSRVELHWLWLSRENIRRRAVASVAFAPGDRVGVFHIPHERECIYEVRSFEQTPARVRVARLRDVDGQLQVIGGTLPIDL
jgi:hypothetical protein